MDYEKRELPAGAVAGQVIAHETFFHYVSGASDYILSAPELTNVDYSGLFRKYKPNPGAVFSDKACKGICKALDINSDDIR